MTHYNRNTKQPINIAGEAAQAIRDEEAYDASPGEQMGIGLSRIKKVLEDHRKATGKTLLQILDDIAARHEGLI